MEIKHQIDDELTIEKNKMTKKKSSTRGMHMFRLVMYMLRRRQRNGKSLNIGFWRRMINSNRRHRLKSSNSDDNIAKMSSSNNVNTITLLPNPTVEIVLNEPNGFNDPKERLSETIDVFTAASSSSSGISGYGSALSLRDLDCHVDDDDDECYSDVYGGDDMIDEKAEEFIMRFYEQMKIQNQAYTDHRKAKGNKDMM